jgi:polyvinyl alcohol dehydrogenase (cytochrome)
MPLKSLRYASLLLVILTLLTLFSTTTAFADDDDDDDNDGERIDRIAADYRDWRSWGHDPIGTRYNPFADLKASNADKLKLKWAFVFPDAVSASSQPAVVDDVLYVGGWNAKFYALDAKTGQLKWTYDTASFTGALPPGANAVRNGPAVEGRTVYFGDLIGNGYALDTRTGAVRWAKRLDAHPFARITASPLVWRGKVYFGVSSVESGVALDPTYPCCTFRGSLVALNAENGNEAWRYWTVAQTPTQVGVNSIGTPIFAPSGAAVWGSPSLDPFSNTIYFGTGQNYSKPTTNRSDTLIALNATTGQERWANQLTPNDRWNLSCNPEAIGFPPGAGPNCPAPSGTDADFDIGGTPNIFITKIRGRVRTLVGVGQKSGIYHALDSRTGEIVWQARLASVEPVGASGIQWGSAWDGDRIYVSTHQANPGKLFALDPENGKVLWYSANPSNGCTTGGATGNPACKLALPAAATAVRGAVVLGSWDGKLRVYNSKNGKIEWTYDTIRSYTGTNGVTGTGGSINGAGAVAVGKFVYVNSGYFPFPGGGIAGNVLLAFSL